MSIKINVGDNSFVAEEKTFSTGSRGYSAHGKALINGKRYQVSMNIVEIGSKPGSGVSVAKTANGQAASF